MTCSYFEQVQGQSNYYRRREEVLWKLDSWMTRAFNEVHDRGEHDQVSLRDAAYVIAVDRVARACRQRGCGEARTLWAGALATFGARARELTFLRAHASSAPTPAAVAECGR